MFDFVKITTVLYHKQHNDNLAFVLDTVTKGWGGPLIRYEKIYLGRILQVFAQKIGGGGVI